MTTECSLDAWAMPAAKAQLQCSKGAGTGSRSQHSPNSWSYPWDIRQLAASSSAQGLPDGHARACHKATFREGRKGVLTAM